MSKSFLFGSFLSLFLISAAGASAAAPFSDIPNDDTELLKAVTFLRDQGIVAGYSDGTYRPDDRINRYDFTKIIVSSRISEDTVRNCNENANFFPDVPAREWFSTYVCAAKENGIVNGFGDGMFKGNNEVTIYEALKMILKAYKVDVSGKDGPETNWYAPYVEYARNAGLASGIEESPSYRITRGDMARLIVRVEENIQRSSLEGKSANPEDFPQNPPKTSSSASSNDFPNLIELPQWGIRFHTAGTYKSILHQGNTIAVLGDAENPFGWSLRGDGRYEICSGDKCSSWLMIEKTPKLIPDDATGIPSGELVSESVAGTRLGVGNRWVFEHPLSKETFEISFSGLDGLPPQHAQLEFLPPQCTTPGCSLQQNDVIPFDGCGEPEKYQNRTWFQDLETQLKQEKVYSHLDMLNESTILGGPITLRTELENETFGQFYEQNFPPDQDYTPESPIGELCVGKNNSMVIILTKSEYMSPTSIFRYFPESSVLERAFIVSPDRPATRSFFGFGKRQATSDGESVIPLFGRSGDAGSGAEYVYFYDFMTNTLALIKECSIDNGNDPDTSCEKELEDAYGLPLP